MRVSAARLADAAYQPLCYVGILKVIDLLKRVTRVSIETMKIVEAMRAEKR